MWDYDQYIAKVKLYFSRSDVQHKAVESYPPEAALWLLLGLEFLLRAPLARIHPTLLAQPEGKSILHAAGYARPNMNPRSIPTKTVVDRLLHVEPEFGEDRGKDALFLADLRNSELHTSEAALEGLAIEIWLPRFIDVVESVCNHLSVPVSDLLDEDIVEHAQAARARNDHSLKATAAKAIEAAKEFYSRLRAEEVQSRKAERLTNPYGARRPERDVACPACAEENAATVWLAPGKSSRSEYDEDTGMISYTTTYLAEGLSCRVCSLSFATTAQLVAAGVDRLYVTEFEEDRYEGWEQTVSYSEAMELVSSADPPYEYGND